MRTTMERATTCRRARPTLGFAVVVTTKSGTTLKGPFTEAVAEQVRSMLHPSLIKSAKVLPIDRTPFGARGALSR